VNRDHERHQGGIGTQYAAPTPTYRESDAGVDATALTGLSAARRGLDQLAEPRVVAAQHVAAAVAADARRENRCKYMPGNGERKECWCHKW
jgi:hypothetical protein